MASNNRILVLDGGGQLGAFEWGVMRELHRQGVDYSFFDNYLTTSAGAFNACFFLSEQFDEGERIWLEHLPNGFWKFCKNDISYLRRILTQIEKLDCDLIVNRREKIYVTLSDCVACEAVYKKLETAGEVVPTLLAGCAMPFLSGPLAVDGRKYYDGGLVSQPPINKALEFRSSEIWVISTKPSGYRVSSFFWKLVSCLAPDSAARRLLYNYPDTQNYTMELMESVNGLRIIRPLTVLPIGFRSSDKVRIKAIYELGKQSAINFLRAYHD